VQRIENLIADSVAGLMPTAVVVQRQEEERKAREPQEHKRAQEGAQLQKDIQEEERSWSNSTNGLKTENVRNSYDAS
jgi:hypothetical protein